MTPQAYARCSTVADGGVLVNSSRSILYAYESSAAGYREAAREAAREARDELRLAGAHL